MGGSHRSYDYETKLSAARDHVEGGMSKPDVMKKYGIAACPAELVGAKVPRGRAPEALRPKPKGRPPGSASSAKPKTVEQENRRGEPQAQGGGRLPKKLRALEAAKRRGRKCQVIRGAFREGAQARRPAGRIRRAGVDLPLQQGQGGRRRRQGRSSGRASPRCSRAPPTAAATGRSRCACVPRRKPPWRTRRCSRSCTRWA